MIKPKEQKWEKGARKVKEKENQVKKRKTKRRAGKNRINDMDYNEEDIREDRNINKGYLDTTQSSQIGIRTKRK